jgi:hypothetical protein
VITQQRGVRPLAGTELVALDGAERGGIRSETGGRIR